ncbi:MAG: GlsB/YeaQ/YmgE family stress response membrane protein [Anaerolineales bacterium]|jgi:uncharacterized membrane protein YeaQ/YmgE (transglycosylase-associated protein family)
MGILSWIIVGLIAGWLANTVMKGSGQGLLSNLILGIVGALVGGFLAGPLLGVEDAVSGINITSIVIAVLGAIVVIAIVRAFSGRR